MSEPRTLTTQCCIAGGGPAGMMLGFLLARAGVQVVVLEKHADFLRDFRGDTVHPSTLMIMDELGLLQDFLKIPHSQLTKLEGRFGQETLRIGDFSGIKGPCKFIAMMPQWDFLDFIADQGRALPGFTVIMQAEVTDLLRGGDRVTGVTATTPDGPLTVSAPLTVGCDGRRSTVREKSGLPLQEIGAPIDVLWFRLSRDPAKGRDIFASIQGNKFIVTIDRGDYWQCAYVIAKGGHAALKARGIEAFRRDVAEAVPDLAAQVAELTDWDDIKLLSVAVDRLTRWSAPGLLCIGDAAHAMSPVGGVGINLAIQDAVATANLLAEGLRTGTLTDTDVEAVQRRRAWPVKVVQAAQVFVQKRLLSAVITSNGKPVTLPLPLRLANRFGFVRRLLARFVGMGVRPEHVQSGKA